MKKLAIIGGTGLSKLTGLKVIDIIEQGNHWGQPSGPIIDGQINNKHMLFLARHGNPHTIPPHKVNYRANIQALKDAGVTDIIAVNAVGGITSGMQPCQVVIPNQLIDYTYDRSHTFFEENLETVTHVDFTDPYDTTTRKLLIKSAEQIDLDIIEHGVYGVTQGPRLETKAEIKRMQQDGCDIVGMTGMPEAVLARELGLRYACCALIVNWAAGKTDEIITMQLINKNLNKGMSKVKYLLESVIQQY